MSYCCCRTIRSLRGRLALLWVIVINLTGMYIATGEAQWVRVTVAVIAISLSVVIIFRNHRSLWPSNGCTCCGAGRRLEDR